jgi:hypothetical protein
MKALIITPILTEEREFENIKEFLEMMKRRFKWFLVNFYFNKKYDLVILAV